MDFGVWTKACEFAVGMLNGLSQPLAMALEEPRGIHNIHLIVAVGTFHDRPLVPMEEM